MTLLSTSGKRLSSAEAGRSMRNSEKNAVHEAQSFMFPLHEWRLTKHLGVELLLTRDLRIKLPLHVRQRCLHVGRCGVKLGRTHEILWRK